MKILGKSIWNDERLDEFSRRTDESLKEIREGIAAINQRFDRLTNTLIAIGGAAFVAFLGNGIFG